MCVVGAWISGDWRMEAEHQSDKMWEDWLFYKQRGTFVARYELYWAVARRESSRGLPRIDLFARKSAEQATSSLSIPLQDVLHIVNREARARKFAFQILGTDNKYHLATESREQRQQWVRCLEDLLFGPPKPGIIYEYQVQLLPNSHSERLHLSGCYIIRISDTEIALYTSTGTLPTRLHYSLMDIVRTRYTNFTNSGQKFSILVLYCHSAGDQVEEGTYVFQTHAASTISKTIDHRVKEMAKREGIDRREPPPSRTLNLQVSTAQFHSLPRSPSPLSPSAYPIHHTMHVQRDHAPSTPVDDGNLHLNQQSNANSHVISKPHPPPKPCRHEPGQILAQPTNHVTGQGHGGGSEGVEGEEVEVKAEKKSVFLGTTSSTAAPTSLPSSAPDGSVRDGDRSKNRVMVAVPVALQSQTHTRKKAPIPLPRKKFSSLDSPPHNTPYPPPPPKPKLKKASSVDVAMVSTQKLGSVLASNHGNRDGESAGFRDSHRYVQYMNLPPVESGEGEDVLEEQTNSISRDNITSEGRTGHSHCYYNLSVMEDDTHASHNSSAPCSKTSTSAVNLGHSTNYYNLCPLEDDTCVNVSQNSPTLRPSTEEFLARILQSEEGGREKEREGQWIQGPEPAARSHKSQEVEGGEGKGAALHSERGHTQYNKQKEHPVLGRAKSSNAVTSSTQDKVWSSNSRSMKNTSNIDIHNDKRPVHKTANGEQGKPHMYYNLLVLDHNDHWQGGGGGEGTGRGEGGERGRGEGGERGRGEGGEGGRGECRRLGPENDGEEQFSGSMDVRQFPSEWLGTMQEKQEEEGRGEEKGGDEEEEKGGRNDVTSVNHGGNDVQNTYLQILPSSHTPPPSAPYPAPHPSLPHTYSKRPKPPKPPVKPSLHMQRHRKNNVTALMNAFGQEQTMATHSPNSPMLVSSGGDSPCTPNSCSPLWLGREAGSSLAACADTQPFSSRGAFVWPSHWVGEDGNTSPKGSTQRSHDELSTMTELTQKEVEDEEEEKWQRMESGRKDAFSKWGTCTSDDYDYPYSSTTDFRPLTHGSTLVHSLSCSELFETMMSISDRPPAPLPSTAEDSVPQTPVSTQLDPERRFRRSFYRRRARSHDLLDRASQVYEELECSYDYISDRGAVNRLLREEGEYVDINQPSPPDASFSPSPTHTTNVLSPPPPPPRPPQTLPASDV